MSALQTPAAPGHPRQQTERRVMPLSMATPESFARYGQIVMPMEDGVAFGADDAQLDLSAGVPRFYSMQLRNRGAIVRHVTRHKRVTQCLGSMLGASWFLAVAAPAPDRETPVLESLRAFLVPGDRFVMLHKGTWHAGPYFDAPTALFYNLELADTNLTDHDTCNLPAAWGLELEFGARAVDGWQVG